MSDLYNRLREIRSRTGSAQPSSSTPISPTSGTHPPPARPPAPRVSVAPGPDWETLHPGVFGRTTVRHLPHTPFSPDGRWETLSYLTRQPRGRTPVFIDTETTGLSGGAGTVAFLVGLGIPLDAGRLAVRQLFLADPASERDFLDRLLEILAAVSSPLYITYNGGSFDLPVLRSRCIMNRLTFPEEPHWDVLHPVRRLYATRIGSCSLGNVEARVLGRPRIDDIPGREAPERYRAFLTARTPQPILPIIEHHMRDIAHLAEVALILNSVLQSDTPPAAGTTPLAQLPPDPVELARFLLRYGDPQDRKRALTLLEGEYHRHGVPTRRWIRVRELLAGELRHTGDAPRYRAIREELYGVLQRKSDLVALVKILEHRDRDYHRAMVAIREWADRSGWDGELRHRYDRLERKEARRRELRTRPPHGPG